MFDKINMHLGRRVRQINRLWRINGAKDLLDRARLILADRIKPRNARLPVRATDLTSANFNKPIERWGARDSSHGPLALNWVMTPPNAGSGGHTTIFRIINDLVRRGYNIRVYFYDVYGGDHRFYRNIVQKYFGFHGIIDNVDDGILDADGIVATSWPTAYPVYNSTAFGMRFYFVQDFEPHFHPYGSERTFAENTYSMGFHGITAGRWLSEKLMSDYKMTAESFDFGADTSRYFRIKESNRDGVAFYAQPASKRRGYEIGIMALQIFASRNPNVPIHIYGGKVGSLPFPFVDHGFVNPDQLNKIYNHSKVGLSLSLTNVSLVPHEMLAAGCVPVVNDAEHNRIVLNNRLVRYAAANPHSLAGQLEDLFHASDPESLSEAAAESVRLVRWADAGEKVDHIFRRMLVV